MPDINTNNEMSVINLMILMQSSKQTDTCITLNSCVVVEHFTYLTSELSCEMLLVMGTSDMFLIFFHWQTHLITMYVILQKLLIKVYLKITNS